VILLFVCERGMISFADFENKLKMMGFDVNSQGTAAMVDLPPGNRLAALPPKPRTVSTSSVDAGKKPATAMSSVSSTPLSSGSGGYSLYSLIKKQSQSTPAVQKPVVADTKSSVSSPAKSQASGVPAGVLKKPSEVASVTSVKPRANSATVSHATVTFANPAEKSIAVNKDIETDFTNSHRSVLLLYLPFCFPLPSSPLSCRQYVDEHSLALVDKRLLHFAS